MPSASCRVTTRSAWCRSSRPTAPPSTGCVARCPAAAVRAGPRSAARFAWPRPSRPALLGDRRPAPAVAVLATVQRVLADPRTRPAMFASCADHPATHDAIVRAVATLDGVFTLDGDHRALLAGLAGGRASAAAVCTVVAQVRTQLLASGFVDAAEILRTAHAGCVDDQPDRPTARRAAGRGGHSAVQPRARRVPACARRARRRSTIVVAASSRLPELSVGPHVSADHRPAGRGAGPPAHTAPAGRARRGVVPRPRRRGPRGHSAHRRPARARRRGRPHRRLLPARRAAPRLRWRRR